MSVYHFNNTICLVFHFNLFYEIEVDNERQCCEGTYLFSSTYMLEKAEEIISASTYVINTL